MPEETEVITAPETTPQPAAPAATPAAPSAAAPAATPSKVKDPFEAAYSKIAPSKKDEKKDGGPQPANKTDDKGGEPAATTKKVADKKEGIEEVRGRVATLTTDVQAKDATIKQLQEKIQFMEKQTGGDVQSLAERNEELENQLKQLRGEIGAKDYTKTEEYSSKYEAPFNQAAEYAKEVVESLTVTEQDGTERTADWKKDFAPIYQLPRSAARLRAKEMFGEDAASVMQHYDELHKLDSIKQKAVSEWQKNSTEREKQERGKSVETKQRIAKGFDLVTEQITNDDPTFQIKPDDKEASDTWNATKAIVDKAYFGRDKMNIGELITLDAAIRLRAINEPVLRQKLAKITAERDELLARINGKQRSASGDTRRTTEAAPASGEAGDFAKDLRTALNQAG